MLLLFLSLVYFICLISWVLRNLKIAKLTSMETAVTSFNTALVKDRGFTKIKRIIKLKKNAENELARCMLVTTET